MQYKIFINDRNYENWSLYDPLTFEEIYKSAGGLPAPAVPPAKYFNKDIFEVGGDGGGTPPTIIHSPVREAEYLAGILILEGNKTYGRAGAAGAAGKKLLYRCIPDDKRIPVFLIPYTEKIGFSKKSTNKYVLFRYVNWDEKHPRGVLTQTLGDVSSLEAFYIYQLYRKSLQIPISDFSHKIKECLCGGGGDAAQIDAIRNNPRFVFEDRGGEAAPRIITIDNPNTVDFDDATSVRPRAGGGGAVVSIYITNVVYVLETLDLWNSLTRRVATIYLPDGRRPMLPSLLTDSLCSLQAGRTRFCLACDVEVGAAGEVVSVKFCAAEICVAKNYSYFSPELEDDPTYKELLRITGKMDVHVRQSPELISFWMIKMNTFCAASGAGIFRVGGGGGGSGGEFSPVLPENLDSETRRVIETWTYTSGQYVCSAAAAGGYTHITSPIRRLVDLLNQIMFLENIGALTNKSASATEFLEKWLGELEYINTAMRAIKKIQNDCYLLERCMNSPDVLEKIYEGVVFDKIERRNDSGICTFMVYLKELRLLSRVSVLCASPESEMENYTSAQFRICLFEDKVSMRQKIKLAIA
jgi:exoribonuclease R